MATAVRSNLLSTAPTEGLHTDSSNTGVGKSCLLLRFTEDSFTPSFITTIGIDFKIRTLELDGKRVKLQIWDTAGQERFRTITTVYYRGAMGIMLVYDVTDQKSFDDIKTWFGQVEQHASEDVNRILVANKCDVPPSERAVSFEQGKQLADSIGVPFVEASAKTNVGVEEAFLSVARSIMHRLQAAGGAGNESQAASAVKLDSGGSGGGIKSRCC